MCDCGARVKEEVHALFRCLQSLALREIFIVGARDITKERDLDEAALMLFVMDPDEKIKCIGGKFVYGVLKLSGNKLIGD